MTELVGERPVPERLTVKPASQVPDRFMFAPTYEPLAGESMVKRGARLSRKKFLEADPVFPAASVCDAVTVFVPSKAEVLRSAEKTPFVQAVDVEGKIPAPESCTVKLDSQVPVTLKLAPM